MKYRRKTAEYPSEYGSYVAMRGRCYNSNRPEYPNYGGRGITVCQSWLDSFDNFMADMGPKPTKDHTLDRIDNDLGYCKENCKWSTMKEQNINTRRNIYITKDGETLTISQWSERMGFKKHVIRDRIKKGTDPFSPIKKSMSHPKQAKL